MKLVSGIIREMFDGNIARFLEEEEFVVGDIKELLDQQFQRLSLQEQEIMFWLAIERKGISLGELQTDSVNLLSKGDLLTVLNSLRYRSLVEINTVGGSRCFTLQSVIMEYVTNTFVERIYDEIASESPKVFASHALLKAQVEDYIRNSQVRLILEPIARRLLATFGKEESAQKLRRILSTLRKNTPEYAAGNILNLLMKLQCDLRGYDFSHLVVWQAYLRGATLQYINFTSSDLTRSIFTDTFGSILAVAHHPDSESTLLAIGTATCEVRIYRAGIPFTICQGHKDWVRSVAFSPDGESLVSGSDDQTIRVWNIQTGQCLQTFEGHSGHVGSVAFSPDGQTIVSGSDDHTICLWSIRTGQSIKILQGHKGRVYSVAYHPDGYVIASGSDDQTVRLWDAATGQCLKTLSGHSKRVYAVAYSPDGRLVASGSEDQTIRLWDAATGQCLKIMKGHKGRIYAIAFSPDGHLIASSSQDQTMRLWDAATGQYLRSLSGHKGTVWSVAFTHTDALISGSDDQALRLWNATTGECLGIWQKHFRIRSVACRPGSSQVLISGNYDGTVDIWDLQTEVCIRTLKSDQPYEGTNISDVQGLTDAQKVILRTLGATGHSIT